MNFPLSNTPFWDVEPAQLDINKHSDFIISRVMRYGLLEDVRFIVRNFSDEQINQALRNQREVDSITLDFAKALGFLSNE